MTDSVNNGAAMQVIAAWYTKDKWPHSAPYVEWPKEKIRADLEGWGTVGKVTTKVE